MDFTELQYYKLALFETWDSGVKSEMGCFPRDIFCLYRWMDFLHLPRFDETAVMTLQIITNYPSAASC